MTAMAATRRCTTGGALRPKCDGRWVRASDLPDTMPPMLSNRLTLAPGRPAKLEGRHGTNKSTLAADLAVCVAAGRDAAWGETIDLTAGGSVLWVAGESVRMVAPILRRVTVGHGLDWQTVGGRIEVASTLRLTERGVEHELEEACQGQALAVFDSRTSLCPGLDHDKPEAAEPMAMLERVSLATECTMLVLDHDGWKSNGHARGSSAVADAADLVMGVRSTAHGSKRRITCRKCSLSAKWSPIDLGVHYGVNSIRVVGADAEHTQTVAGSCEQKPADEAEIMREVLRLREDGLSNEEIAKRVRKRKAWVGNITSGRTSVPGSPLPLGTPTPREPEP